MKATPFFSHQISVNEKFTDLPSYLIETINNRKEHGVEFAIMVRSPLFSSTRPDTKRYGILLVGIIEID